LHAAEASGYQAFRILRWVDASTEHVQAAEITTLIRSLRGAVDRTAWQGLLRSAYTRRNTQFKGVVIADVAQHALWRGGDTVARAFAQEAWGLAGIQRLEFDFIRAARLQGEAALAAGDVDAADERLHHALTRARAVNQADEELSALTALAKLHGRRRATTT